MPQVKLISPITRQEIRKVRVAAYCRVSSNAADQAALQSSNVKQSAAVALNKNSMTIGEGWTDQDLTLQNATGTVTWVSGNEAVAKSKQYR